MLEVVLDDGTSNNNSSSSRSRCDETQSTNESSANLTINTNNISSNSCSHELSIPAVREFILTNNGKCKYSDLFNHFRDLIVDSSTDEKFQEYISNVAIRKTEFTNSNTTEWLMLKKKFYESSPILPQNSSGFFANTLQRTKNNFTKFSNALQSIKVDKENRPNSGSSNTNSNYILPTISNLVKPGSFLSENTQSYSASNLTSISECESNNSNSKMFKKKSSRKSSSLVILDPEKLMNTNSNNTNSTSLCLQNTNEDECDDYQNEEQILSSTLALENEYQNQPAQPPANSHNNQTVSIKSVKEHAKKLNRLSTETQLNKLNNNNKMDLNMMNNANGGNQNKSSNRFTTKNLEIESFDFSDPKSHEKEWILVCSRGDYMEMARILSKQPYLAQKKDPFSGYTGAHWACKYGNLEILKLIASVLENDTKTNPKLIRINHLINSKTRAGYTCLHVAYIFNHSEIVSLLRAYGAEGLTDYSGKIGIDYGRTMSHPYESRPVIAAAVADSDKASEKSSLNISINDASSFIKRSSSAILAKEKEKESKENSFGFSSMKLTESKSSRPKITAANLLVSSPLKQNSLFKSSPQPPVATSLNEVNSTPSLGSIKEQNFGLMPPPQSTVILRVKTAKKIQTPKDMDNGMDQANSRESKENIFI